MATIFDSAPSSTTNQISSKISFSCILIGKKIKRGHPFDTIAAYNSGVKIQNSGKRRVRCDMEKKGMRAAVIGVVSGVTNTMGGGAAVGLVDERMSTEGTGLPFGLSNNILGWILLGVFGLIWAFYVVYASGLDEDEDSGLSL